MFDAPAQSTTEPETDEKHEPTPTYTYRNDYDTMIGERWRNHMDPEVHG
jgi:hypothetical protein